MGLMNRTLMAPPLDGISIVVPRGRLSYTFLCPPFFDLSVRSGELSVSSRARFTRDRWLVFSRSLALNFRGLAETRPDVCRIGRARYRGAHIAARIL